MNKELIAIFDYLEHEKGIKRDIIVKAIEESLTVAARKKNRGVNNVAVEVSPKTGDITVYAQKEVVDKVEYPEEEILFEEAVSFDPEVKLGDLLEVIITPEDFGRIAAQTARQIIAQKLRSAEKEVIYSEFRERVGELVSGTVRRIAKGGTLIVDLGKVEALLPTRFYPKTESYQIGDRVFALLYEVQDNEYGGAEVILTRSHPEFVEILMQQEIPELSDGTVQIRKTVREAGLKTKVALSSSDFRVDPVGACVGVRGARIKNVLREIGNERIDLFIWSDDVDTLVRNAIYPTEIKKIYRNDSGAMMIVVEDELYPSALGRKGVNARLLSQLIELPVSIYRESDFEQDLLEEQQRLFDSNDPKLEESLESVPSLHPFVVETLLSQGYSSLKQFLEIHPASLVKSTGLSPEMVDEILDKIRKYIGSPH